MEYINIFKINKPARPHLYLTSVRVRVRVRLGLAVIATFVAREVDSGERVNGCPRALLLDHEGTELHAHVAHLAPELAPAVADVPVVLAADLVETPASDRDDVVHTLSRHGRDAARVLEDWSGVNATTDWATRQNFLLHGVGAGDGAVFGDGGVRVLAEAEALALWWEGGARAGDVDGGAVPLAGGAEAFGGLGGAGHVRVGGFVADAGAGRLRDLVKPLVRAIDGAAVARADVTAVQDVLDGDVDVDALAFAGDLDAVTEGGDGAVGPA